MAQLDEGCAGVNFLDKVQSHKGGLIRLKCQLYWYGDRGYDNSPGRICLLLDAAESTTAAAADTAASFAEAAARLLIDGKPHWIWVAEQDIDILVNDPPAS